MRLPRLWRRRQQLDLLSTDPKVLFGQTVGVQVPPDTDLDEFVNQLGNQWGKESMRRIDRTRDRGLWTPEMERLWETLCDLPQGDPRIEDTVHALWAENLRIERENPGR